MARPEDSPGGSPWMAVSVAFAALGRIFICLDQRFRVLHASMLLDHLYGEGTSTWIEGKPVEEVLGQELFGAEGTLRHALLLGERQEGWRALLRLQDEKTRLMSVTVAPLSFSLAAGAGCDPRALYLVVLRPAEEDLDAGTGPPTAFKGLVARSAVMGRIIRLVESLHHSEATVLLTGESGTGKEVVARAIHAASPRRDGSFVAVSCGALPGDLLESELFGHVRGAYTGATRDRIGRFELASGGTLFLDEVGDVPLQLQVKLLRVLQERTFEPVGESRSRQTDARIIAATNVDLPRAVREGKFREDLYYRLRVVPIELPPLRGRREDIEPLARYLLARVSSRQGRLLRFSPDTLRVLMAYPWPGNVRELENALEYAMAVSNRQTILPEDLPDEVRGQKTGLAPAEARPKGPAAAAEPLDAQRLRSALDEHQWRRAETARALGISRSTLWRRMRELGLG